VESTTYPGTTRERMVPILEESGLAVGRDFHLAFSPERIDPGRTDYTVRTTPKLVGGITEGCAERARELYSLICDEVVVLSTPEAAELAKLLENIFRSVNIALVNELAQLCDRLGIDVWEVIEAAKTKPFGFTPFYPGPGLGGHCIPIDPFYLSWKAREYELTTRFIELAGEINASMPGHVVEAVSEALNRRRQCLHDSRILVLGVAYKKDIDDLRESPSLRVIELLMERGARVDYNDPYFPRLHKMRRYDFGLASADLTAEALAGYAAVVIVTDHSSYDYEFIARHSRLVIDTRNATRNLRQYTEKIVHC